MVASSSSCLLLCLHTLLDEQRGVATIIYDEIGAAVDSSVEAPISAPLVLLEGVSLPGEDNGRVTGDGGGGMELGGEDVAGAPADLDSEGGEGFDEDDGGGQAWSTEKKEEESEGELASGFYEKCYGCEQRPVSYLQQLLSLKECEVS
ncbi:hypothetical protein MRB53_026047 [Persea americana]|uniref:Uncharacterized protein n=1 Tax=Persea americana TaxID=3435 RepID=A0ACC2LGY5_PERAE|nr:hypothetical protein MRB53_026047 [Persea americana]